MLLNASEFEALLNKAEEAYTYGGQTSDATRAIHPSPPTTVITSPVSRALIWSSGAGPVVVALRGTETLADAMCDVLIPLVNINDVRKPLVDFGLPEVRVHLGFKEAFLCLKANGLLDEIKLCANEHVMITGHSLGGALATLVGLELALTTPLSVSVITWGSPMVGDAQFKRLSDSQPNLRITRVENETDLVTLMPAALGACGFEDCKGYVHVGETRVLNPSANAADMVTNYIDSFVTKLVLEKPETEAWKSATNAALNSSAHKLTTYRSNLGPAPRSSLGALPLATVFEACVRRVLKKPSYHFGDGVNTIVSNITGQESYTPGDFTRAAGRRITGDKDYQIGDGVKRIFGWFRT